MASVLYIGEDVPLAEQHAAKLRASGYDVQVEHDQLKARGRLDGPTVDLLIVDVPSPDGGAGLFLGQARAAWPRARILALISRQDPSQTAIGRMGLWDPDQTLSRRASSESLVAKADAMLAVRRSDV